MNVGLHLSKLVGENFVEMDAEFVFHILLLQLEVAHDLHDHITAQLIVFVEVIAAVRGQPSFFNGGGPIVGAFGIELGGARDLDRIGKRLAHGGAGNKARHRHLAPRL